MDIPLSYLWVVCEPEGINMGKIICRIKRKREEGKLYYVAFDKEGYLLIGEAELCKGGRKKAKKIRTNTKSKSKTYKGKTQKTSYNSPLYASSIKGAK